MRADSGHKTIFFRTEELPKILRILADAPVQIFGAHSERLIESKREAN